jgi:hypothetical protein
MRSKKNINRRWEPIADCKSERFLSREPLLNPGDKSQHRRGCPSSAWHISDRHRRTVKVRKLRRIIVAVIIPISILGAASAAVAAPVAQSATIRPATPPPPPGTPTGCPMYNLCSYLGTGDGQGASDICFYASGNVPNWAARSGPGDKNCHSHSGALVNTHTTGAVELWEGKSYGGEEACINHGSYYENTNFNYYPNGDSLHNNIDSSKQNTSLSC